MSSGQNDNRDLHPRDHPAISLTMLAVCLITLGGCSLSDWAHNGFKVGPNYKPPPGRVAGYWIDSDDPRVLAEPLEFADWWAVLKDPTVNALVQAAYEQNLTLRQAGTRILQARAARAITVGELFPQLQQAFGDFTRFQNSQTVAVPPPILNFDQWDLGFGASWEVDVWGKFRRAVESSDASLEASIREYDAILVCLIAEVVSAYVDIRTFEQRLVYARQNVRTQDSSLDLSTDRFDEGKTSKVGVTLAEASLYGTEATIPNLEAGLRQAKNRLCTLLGIPPTDLTELLDEGTGIPSVPAEIAVGIPADLLRRRPDVRQAEREVAAQSAQIGVAAADLYPSISIRGDIFLTSKNFSDLFRSASTAGSVGPSFTWNVLNYGRIVNNVLLQDARLLELIAKYQQTVLEANQEVEDALVEFLRSQQEVEFLRQYVEALENSLELLLIQFEEGSIDFSSIFVLQGSLTLAQDQYAEARGRVLLNMIAVYKALGGGWQIRCPGFQPQALPTDGPPELVPVPPSEPILPPSIDAGKSDATANDLELPAPISLTNEVPQDEKQ